MKNEKELGSYIKEQRLSLNLTMDCLAQKVGISRATLSSIENGNGNASITTIIKIADILKMELFFTNKNQNIQNRERATRTNRLIDKKINRFIIMCVEQFAQSIDKPSKYAYAKMEEAGIIKELSDDYEDLHGMSTEYLNDYFRSIVGENI